MKALILRFGVVLGMGLAVIALGEEPYDETWARNILSYQQNPAFLNPLRGVARRISKVLRESLDCAKVWR